VSYTSHYVLNLIEFAILDHLPMAQPTSKTESPQSTPQPTIEPYGSDGSDGSYFSPLSSEDATVSSPMTPIPMVPPSTPDAGISPSQIPSRRRLSSITYVDIPSPLVGPHESPRDLGSLAEWHCQACKHIPEMNLQDSGKGNSFSLEEHSNSEQKGAQQSNGSLEMESKIKSPNHPTKIPKSNDSGNSVTRSP
jgi:hypothetical protein